MSLDKYKEKRDFSKTPEPSGDGAPRGRGNTFVVHKHDATNLHYDLRLEVGGLYWSWAVPNGPSLDPKVRNLAVRVEDHPIAYGDFEGVIPPKEYGAGTVMVWDRGAWLPKEDPVEQAKKGMIKFELHGEKLRGKFALVQLKVEGGLPDPKNWLLIKDKDEEAREGYDVLAEQPDSVKTGRTLEQIAWKRQRKWDLDEGEMANEEAREAPVKEAVEVPDASGLPGAREGKMDIHWRPLLATLSKDVPTDDQWIHEIKYDGYRALAFLEGERARLFTRNGHDWTDRFGLVAPAVEDFPVDSAVFDGEVAVLEPNGTTSFQALQNALRLGTKAPLVYFIFDLLYLDGVDLRDVRLHHRKKVLGELFAACDFGDSVIRFSDHIDGSGEEVYRQASQFALEGIVSKRRDSRYRAGRTTDWLKIKFSLREEFVIGGFTDPGASRVGFGALVVGTHDGCGNLIYTGRVGTGFSDSFLTTLKQRLTELERDTSPFFQSPKGLASRGVHWIEPELVAQVEFTGWTEDEHLRHPSFQGLREDLDPEDVVGFPDRQSEPGKVRKKKKAPAKEKAEDAAEPKKSGATERDSIQLMDGLRLTNPDRVLYPERGITKIGLCEFYVEIASWILPHIEERPLSLVRCPAGQGKETFYQKHANDSVPEVVGRLELQEKKGKEFVTGLYVEHLASLIGLVQIGVLEVHVWGSKIDEIEKPDRMILDLDPDVALPWFKVIEGAEAVRDRLDDLGLESFVKTTGGKGLHVVVPLTPKHSWDEMMGFSQAISESIAADDPDRFTVIQSMARRKGKIYLDFRRNARGATAIAAYSTRAHPLATVSVPLAWDELERCLGADYYHVLNLPRRLSALEDDPWDGIDEIKQSITKKARKKVGFDD